MNEHSSTSSSNQRLPAGPWLRIWLVAGVLTLLLVCAAELVLRNRGYTPSLADSSDLWVLARVAAQSADSPIVVLGASRVQLGLDLSELEQHTGRKVIQLAINGSSFVPVLESLAADNGFSGTVLISFDEALLQDERREQKSREWLQHYRSMARRLRFNPFPVWESKITLAVSSLLAMRAEGAPGYFVLGKEWFLPGAYATYVKTSANRERIADYRLVEQPQFYAAVVRRHYGAELPGSVDMETFSAAMGSAVEALQPLSVDRFASATARAIDAADLLEKRGLTVVFVRFPTDKLIWEIDRRRFPRLQFWQPFAKRVTHALHFADHSSLAKFDLPDGSHLDKRDRAAFTRELARIIDDDVGWPE